MFPCCLFFIIFFVSRVFGVRIHSPAVAPRCRAPNLLPSFYWLLCCFFVLFAFVLFSKWSLISEDGDRDAVGSRFRFYFSFLFFCCRLVRFVVLLFVFCWWPEQVAYFGRRRDEWRASMSPRLSPARRRRSHRRSTRVSLGPDRDRLRAQFACHLHAICINLHADRPIGCG